LATSEAQRNVNAAAWEFVAVDLGPAGTGVADVAKTVENKCNQGWDFVAMISPPRTKPNAIQGGNVIFNVPDGSYVGLFKRKKS
jgi:hypothetical protein